MPLNTLRLYRRRDGNGKRVWIPAGVYLVLDSTPKILK